MLLQAEESSRKEEEDTRRRLAKETDAWQKQVHASARKEAQERDEVAKREARDKVRRGQPFRASSAVAAVVVAGGGGVAGK